MNRKSLAALAALCALTAAALWLLLSVKTADFALPVPGKGTITYTCQVTSTEADAKTRADAAHAAFQSRLTALTAIVAETFQAAMLKATETGDRTDLEAANADYKARVIALRADLEREFGCKVDTTLQPEG